MNRSAQRVLYAVLALTAGVVPVSAEAGLRPFFWVYDTEVLPARNVELEQWVWEARGMAESGGALTSLWWAPVVGLTDNVELALPVEWYWYRVTPPGEPAMVHPVTGIDQYPGTHLETVGAEVRIRLDSADPDEAGAFVPLVRLGVKRLLRDDNGFLAEANLVFSYDPTDWLHTAVDLGVFARLDEARVVGTYAAGASFRLNEELRLGAELFGEYFVTPAGRGFVMAGPNFSYVSGRFWLTVGTLIGLSPSAPAVMPRLIWAIAF